MNDKIDVQLVMPGVLLILPPPARDVWVSDDEFDDLAKKVAEAALNKKARESAYIMAAAIEVGDTLMGREVVNVRVNYPAQDLMSVNTRPFSYMLFNAESYVTVERRIQ